MKDMGMSEDDHSHLLNLRHKAEEMLQGKRVAVEGLAAEDIQYLLHELQVHQAELEIQNAELREILMALELSHDQYADLYNFAPAGYCTIDRRDRIQEANLTLTRLLGYEKRELINQTLSRFVDRMDQDKYFLYRRQALKNRGRQAEEIRMVKASGHVIYVHLESTVVNGDDSKLMIMLMDITERRDLERRLLEQREDERQRIARDLHDGPVQMLSAINFSLQSIMMDHPNLDLSQSLGEIQDRLREQLQLLRNYSVELRSPILTHIGLDKAIRSSLENFKEKQPDLIIRPMLNPVGPYLSPESNLALFRICQEALINISKHALHTATEIIVRLEKNEHHILFEIQDNGAGFDLPEDWFTFVKDGHLGLIGMRERAEAVNGRFEIQSSRGAGTVIKVSVPIVNSTQ